MCDEAGRERHFKRPRKDLLLLMSTTQSSTKIVIRSIPILLTMIHTCDCKEW
jgi:hypothetical protein